MLKIALKAALIILRSRVQAPPAPPFALVTPSFGRRRLMLLVSRDVT